MQGCVSSTLVTVAEVANNYIFIGICCVCWHSTWFFCSPACSEIARVSNTLVVVLAVNVQLGMYTKTCNEKASNKDRVIAINVTNAIIIFLKFFFGNSFNVFPL